MLLRMPKMPMDIFFILVGIIFTIGMKMISFPIITNAQNIEMNRNEPLLNIINSKGEFIIDDLVYFDSTDLLILAKKIKLQKDKLEELKVIMNE